MKTILGFLSLVGLASVLGYWYHLTRIQPIGFGCGACVVVVVLVSIHWATD